MEELRSDLGSSPCASHKLRYTVEAAGNSIPTKTQNKGIPVYTNEVTYQRQLILQRFDRKQQRRCHGFEVKQQQAVKRKREFLASATK